jgi:hypothetical protein
MSKYYGTFGGAQPLRGYYVILIAESKSVARQMMLTQFNKDWSSLYSEEEWGTGKNSIAFKEEQTLLVVMRQSKFTHFTSGGVRDEYTYTSSDTEE